MVLIDTQTGIAIGAGIAIGSTAIATAWAQKSIGSAAMGVMAERPESSGKTLLFLVIPETIIILGFVATYLLIDKIVK